MIFGFYPVAWVGTSIFLSNNFAIFVALEAQSENEFGYDGF